MKKGRTVLEAKRYGIYSCGEETTLRDVCRQMMSADVTALVVADDEGYLSGVISQTDILRAHLEEDDWALKPVRAYMSCDAVTVTASAFLRDVAELLLEKRIHRAVVVQEEEGGQRPVAVISSRDLVYHMMKDA